MDRWMPHEIRRMARNEAIAFRGLVLRGVLTRDQAIDTIGVERRLIQDLASGG
jgi:hypothetical protein